jgi:hypothetical protein
MPKHDIYIGLLLEDIQDKLKGLAEAMAGLITKVNVMDKRLEKVEEDTSLMLPILKATAKDQTKQLNNHEVRITKLETVN